MSEAVTELNKDVEIGNLEFRVVEAAVQWQSNQFKWDAPQYIFALNDAVKALIATREKTEKPKSR